ncbi:helix-turn-helix domain-containing protein [Photorhabdus sp. APURE]|uniref:AraC family transcriptional regulator n=1 Tax=Photorhabdus aballayi TaxID=2991723 RepID=UPI00223D9507|nr:helix-turn-helix domain-containing protein [Photorhabdus aballayi]MCW7549099.1 helix-turn-helix domain-containing protein [Photorhabdus aballayi]
MLHKIDKSPYFIKFYKFHLQDLVFSYNMQTEWHHHPCIQLSVSPHNSLMRIDTENESKQVHGFIISSNIRHKLHSEGQLCFNLLIDLANPLCHLLLHQMRGSDIIYLNQESSGLIANYFSHCLQSETSPDIFILNNLLGKIEDCHCYQDKRIMKAASLITELPVKCISSREISNQLYLSESRFLHLFREKMGTNFRSYLLWKRLHHAIDEIHSSDSLTLLACNSGFSDGAHFSRTCMTLYGLRPSELKHASKNRIQQAQQKYFNLSSTFTGLNFTKQNICVMNK